MEHKIKIERAREFRKVPTPSENIMWNALRNRGFLGMKFRRQHIIDGYILDFYCRERRLAIEIDGSIHEHTKRQDIYRQHVLEQKGIRFFRVSSGEVERDIIGVLERLERFVEKLQGR